MNTDDSALGSGVTFDATDQAALTEETNAENSDDETQNGLDFEITASDSYTDENSDTNEESTESQTNAANDDTTESETAAGDDGIVTSNLEVHFMERFCYLLPATSEKNGYAADTAGINMLTISFPREDLIAGSGSVTVSNSADGTSQTIAMNDSSKVTVEPMTESELSKLGWTSGYQAKVLLDEVLAADAQYYVTLSQDAFETQDGIGTTEATDGTGLGQIQTSAYGF